MVCSNCGQNKAMYCAQCHAAGQTVPLDSLVGGISVLQEAVEKLLDSDPQIAGTTDEELEDAIQNGYDPQIRIQAEAILLARNALRMTGSLNPSNDKHQPEA